MRPARALQEDVRASVPTRGAPWSPLLARLEALVDELVDAPASRTRALALELAGELADQVQVLAGDVAFWKGLAGTSLPRDLHAYFAHQAQQAGNARRRERVREARPDLEEAARRNRAGEKWLSIAADLGVTEDALRARIRRAGMAGRGRRKTVTRMPDRTRR